VGDAVGQASATDRCLPRLKNRAQFQAVTAKPPVFQTSHFALHAVPAAQVPELGAHAALGVLLPKRWAKRAVTRNGMRRQIYAVFNDANRESGALSAQGRALVVRLRRPFSREFYVSAWSRPLAREVRAQLTQLSALAIAVGGTP
jgi:ribonuclease P protein component